MKSQTDELHQDITDATMLSRLKAGDHQAFHDLIRTYNQRLFRIARAILREDMEAEDVVQEAYIKAFTHLDSFTGKVGLKRKDWGPGWRGSLPIWPLTAPAKSNARKNSSMIC